VIAETDHKPLIAIAKKDFNEMSPRIQRMMIRLQRYDLMWEYKPGPKLILADVLSRLQCDAQGQLEEEIERHIRVVESRLSEAKRGKIVDATAEDEVSSMVVCEELSGRETAVEHGGQDG